VIRYSAVCAFSDDLSGVVLIHKLKPSWQLNRANFPGGKVEVSDGDDEPGHRLCAVRELQEETGLVVDAVDLTLFCVLRFDGGVCYFYACKTDINKAHTKETETVFLGSVSEVLTGAVEYCPCTQQLADDIEAIYGPSVTLRTMSNLPFLMSMALARVKGIFTRIKHFDVTEVYQ
jgi:8-oxo-dGTP pyrophosphatase MutT (NUDIX family)